MLSIDVQAVQSLLVGRLRDATVPATQVLLDQLAVNTLDGTTSKESSVLHARRLASERFKSPFVAYRGGPIITRDRIVQMPTFRMIVYDEPSKGYWRINTIVPLLSRALLAEPKLSLSVGAVIGDIAVTGVSGETTDPVLNLFMRYLTVSVDTTW